MERRKRRNNVGSRYKAAQGCAKSRGNFLRNVPMQRRAHGVSMGLRELKIERQRETERKDVERAGMVARG